LLPVPLLSRRARAAPPARSAAAGHPAALRPVAVRAILPAPQPAAAALILLILAAAPLYFTKGWTRPVEWVGRKGVVFYCDHLILQRLVFGAMAGAA
jgi:hypothetical protein